MAGGHDRRRDNLRAAFPALASAWTRERVAPVESPSAGGQSILSDMKSLAGNGPWWILLGVAVAALLFNSIRGGAAAYYFKDFIGEDNLLGGSMILSCGAFLAIGRNRQHARGRTGRTHLAAHR